MIKIIGPYDSWFWGHDKLTAGKLETDGEIGVIAIARILPIAHLLGGACRKANAAGLDKTTVAHEVCCHALARLNSARWFDELASISAVSNHRGVNHSLGGTSGKRLHASQMIGQELVIGIEQRDIFPAGHINARITRRTRPLVFLSDQAQTPALHERCASCCNIIRRPIIHSDDFEILEGLTVNRIKALTN